jgi:predicted SnoaL-like aldol condensation-catalyzing enzyme
MRKTTPEQNKALVLEAFDTLFNRRDYGAAERFWSDRYIQHSAHIAPGRDGLFNLIRTLSATLKYENQIIVAEGDFVIAHGRFSALHKRGTPADRSALSNSPFSKGPIKFSVTERNWKTATPISWGLPQCRPERTSPRLSSPRPWPASGVHSPLLNNAVNRSNGVPPWLNGSSHRP